MSRALENSLFFLRKRVSYITLSIGSVMILIKDEDKSLGVMNSSR